MDGSVLPENHYRGDGLEYGFGNRVPIIGQEIRGDQDVST